MQEVSSALAYLFCPALPGPWVLLSKICRSLCPPGFPQLYSGRNGGGVSDVTADVIDVRTVCCRARCRVASPAAVPSRIKLGEPRGTLPVSLPHPNTAPSLPPARRASTRCKSSERRREKAKRGPRSLYFTHSVGVNLLL